MTTESIGGFWAGLKLVSDDKSFNKGLKQLKDVKGSIVDLAKTSIKLFSGTVLGLTAFVSKISEIEKQSGLMAKSLGISGSELAAWKITASAAGVNAEALTGSMMELEKKTNRMKLGEVDVGLAKSLGMLGVGFGQFNQADASKKMSMVYDKAMGMADKEKAGELIRDVLGDAGKDMFTYMQMSGKTLDKILSESKSLTFTTERTKKGAMMFDAEMKSVVGAGKEMMGLFGGQLSIELLPLITNIKKWIIQNKALISSNIVKVAQMIGRVSKDIFNAIRTGLPHLAKLVAMLGGVEGIAKKVAFGFAIFTGGKLAMGFINVAKGLGGVVNVIKAMAGVGAGGALLGIGAVFLALFVILDDVATYMKYGFQEKAGSGRSATGYFLKWLGDVGKAFDNVLTEDGKKALKDMMDFLGKLAKMAVGTGLTFLVDVFTEIGNSIVWAAQKLAFLVNMAAALKEGGLQGVTEFLGKDREKALGWMGKSTTTEMVNEYRKTYLEEFSKTGNSDSMLATTRAQNKMAIKYKDIQTLPFDLQSKFFDNMADIIKDRTSAEKNKMDIVITMNDKGEYVKDITAYAGKGTGKTTIKTAGGLKKK